MSAGDTVSNNVSQLIISLSKEVTKTKLPGYLVCVATSH